jgi:hypothetical protein
MCGDGQFLVAIKKRKLAEGISDKDASNAIYGIDLTQENVDCATVRTLSPNIVCADSLGDTYSTKKPLIKKVKLNAFNSIFEQTSLI